MLDWYTLENTENKWLVDGLLPADTYSAVVGKPKSGKSSLIRNLVASVIKSRPFLNRQINIPEGTGRVLYIHLDRKDIPARVATELKELGITDRDEQLRLRLMFAHELPSDMEQRLAWLKREVAEFKPHLVVIDLMLQFLDMENPNEYKQVLTALNGLQDVLSSANFGGALIAAFHSRKAATPDNPADDVLGSTAIRGSFSTLILLTQDRPKKRYTITSDQTYREAPWGEIDPTEIIRNDDGTMSLGQSLWEVKNEDKIAKREKDIDKLFAFLQRNPGSTVDEIVRELWMSKPNVLRLLESLGEILVSTGKGVKGDPRLYFNSPTGVALSDATLDGPGAREEVEVLAHA